MDNRKISQLVRNQLPDHIRTDHPKFVTFLEKYYEWLEVDGGVLKEGDSLRYSFDIDTASDKYIDRLIENLMPYFPRGMVADKKLFLKKINEFYSRKGSEESLRFAFRAFFNEEIDVYYPKQDILKVSDGKWILPLALRVATNDVNILNIEKTLLTGEISKATALVERVVKSVDRQLGIEYNEVYISNIERYFQTGEDVRATYKNELGIDVTVKGRIVGALSEIKINPDHRGLYYVGYDATIGYNGDPVTIVGGLNPTANSPIGAVATVGETTKGSVTNINVIDGGFGFRDPKNIVESTEVDFSGGFGLSTLAQIAEAKADISLLDLSTYRTLNVTSTQIETISGNTILSIDPANNTIISNVSTYQSLNVYPISLITLTGQGGGYREKPQLDVYSFYNESLSHTLIGSSTNPVPFSIISGTSTLISGNSSVLIATTYSIEKDSLIRIQDSTGKLNDIARVVSATDDRIIIDKQFPVTATGLKVYKILKNELRNLGSLGRISIVNGGSNYSVGDTLIFTGGSGYGANGVVSEIYSSNSGIKAVNIVNHSTNAYVRGGEGYSMSALPNVTVSSANGSGAKLVATEILGDGEKVELSTSRIGAISKLRISSYGYDYINVPTISLRNMDVYISNVTPGKIFTSNTKIYQGSTNTSPTFVAYVDKHDLNSGILRLFNYSGSFSNTSTIKTDDNLVNCNVLSHVVYGDGKAKATARFENGLIRLPGIYVNTDGHISSDKYVQDSEKYHNYSYIINTSKDYNYFKQPFKEVFHPIGMKTFINKVHTDKIDFTTNTNTTIEIVKPFAYTFNISNGSNTIISTNTSINLTNYINVGDTLILTGLNRVISGTANIGQNSNNIVGTSCNYIADLNDDDLIVLSSNPNDLSNTNLVITSDTTTSRANTNDITVEFTRDFIHYCTGQYVPAHFKTFIEQKIDGRHIGDVTNKGFISIIDAYYASAYEQNMSIDSFYESWIKNKIIPYLESNIIYSAYLVNRPIAIVRYNQYFVSDTVIVNKENVLSLGSISPITANNLKIKVFYTDLVKVKNVSSSQIIVDHKMNGNSNNIPIIIRKPI